MIKNANYMKFQLKSTILSASSICGLQGSLIGRKNVKFSNQAEVPASFVDEPLEGDVKPERNFNKSRLRPQHRNFLLEQMPYKEPHSWIHKTEKYQKKMFGRYGLSSNVNPEICFPSKEDIQKREEYERVAFPNTIPKMMEIVRQEKETKRLQIQKREDEIAKKLEKLDQWKAELNAKIMKKEKEATLARERKDRIVEEVRRHFGFKIDPRDERFKELLEQKEKEDRKKQKEVKRKAKEDKMLSKLVDTVKAKTSEEKPAES